MYKRGARSAYFLFPRPTNGNNEPQWYLLEHWFKARQGTKQGRVYTIHTKLCNIATDSVRLLRFKRRIQFRRMAISIGNIFEQAAHLMMGLLPRSKSGPCREPDREMIRIKTRQSLNVYKYPVVHMCWVVSQRSKTANHKPQETFVFFIVDLPRNRA